MFHYKFTEITLLIELSNDVIDTNLLAQKA